MKEEQMMRNRFTKVAAGLAALAALALGGATLASAGQGTTTPVVPMAPVQQGTGKADAETNDAGLKADVETTDGSAKADTDSIQNQSGTDAATEAAGTEQSAASEPAESGSEVAGNDGPGGHADEPGNPNADHQATGAE
jgi:hypothetical protein